MRGKRTVARKQVAELRWMHRFYAIINHTDATQTTLFYDINGEQKEIVLKPYEIKWVSE